MLGFFNYYVINLTFGYALTDLMVLSVLVLVGALTFFYLVFIYLGRSIFFFFL